MTFKTYLPSATVIRNTGWMLMGLGVRFGFQFLAFVLLAHTLGAEAFGAFAGALALATLLSPFVELGGTTLIVEDVTAGVPTRRAVGNSLLLSVLALPLGLAIMGGLKFLFLPQVAWDLVLALGLAEFVGGRLFWLACSAHVANEMVWRNAVLEVVWGGLRLLLVGWLAWSKGDVFLWGWLFLGQSLGMGLLAMGWVMRTWGLLTADFQEIRERVAPGWNFAVGQAAQGAYTDLDKAMLARLSTLEATGIYAAAFRFIPLVYLPLNALINAIYPQFFKAGQQDYRAVRTLAIQIVRLMGAYGILATGVLWVVAPYLPLFFGESFRESVATLRLLAFIPLLQGLYTPFALALTGSGRQTLRTRGQLATLGVNIALNLALIPLWGWAGAAWATLVSQMILLLALSIPVLKNEG